jgi:hypothetical protein
MSGLMRRLTRARAATEDEAAPQEPAASEPVGAAADAPQGGVAVPANGTAETTVQEPATAVPAPGAPVTAPAGEPTTEPIVEPADVPGRDLPAGVDPAELAAVPSSARRGRLRRRLRYLRAVREILLRDLGGFYYEAQRSEPGLDPHRPLLDAKTARLTTLDTEVRDLETRLDEAHPPTVLREPGIGGTCPQCGELHATDARFCSRCGTALRGRPAAKPAAAPVAGDEPKATTASLWGRPKRPDPATAAEPPAAADTPAAPEASAATGSERA